MPIKWSALEVSEAMDEVDTYIDEAIPLLEQARLTVVKATQIERLPQYMRERLYSLEARLGGSQSQFRESVSSVRNSLPEDALQAERECGKQQTLM